MAYRVLLFARLREICGQSECLVELPPSATIGDLRRALSAAHPEMKELVAHCWFAIEAQYVADAIPLGQASEIACIPPVSGG